MTTVTTLTDFCDPSKRVFLWVVNLTKPCLSANNVSSPPRFTPSPGKNFVPRCRIKISPVFTRWPSDFLTPKYFGCESRPYLLAPEDLVCAIVSENLEFQRINFR